MFENKVKGWYGSYSKVGRDSAEKYPMIMLKDKILANQFKKYKIKDYFNTDDDIDNEKTMMEYGEDIFSTTYKRKNERKQKYKNVCSLQKEELMSDEYKYHQIHHKGLYDYYLIIKGQKKYQTNSSVNLPKDDLTTKRVLTGPKWNVLTGRENKSFNKIISYPDFHTPFEKNKNLDNIFEMEKMTQRGNLPTSYDLRIRIDEPFNKTTTKKGIKYLTINCQKPKNQRVQKVKNQKLVLKNMMKKKKIIH